MRKERLVFALTVQARGRLCETTYKKFCRHRRRRSNDRLTPLVTSRFKSLLSN